MSVKFILGVDGGNSKTECAIHEIGGSRRLGARGVGSNHEMLGFETAGLAMRAVVADVLKQGGISPADIAAACFAMAGMDVPPDRDGIRTHMVEPLGLSCPFVICNDAFAGFRAGSSRGIGMCVSVGTGITFCGKNQAGEVLQFEQPCPLGMDALIRNALMSEYLGIGPKCGFTSAYLQALGLETLEEFFLSLYAQSRKFAKAIEPMRIIEARRAVLHPTMFNDPATCALLQKFAWSLADVLGGLGGRLRFGSSEFDLVLSGSILTRGRHPALNDTLIASIAKSFSGARAVVVDGLPVDGALLMAADLLRPGASITA